MRRQAVRYTSEHATSFAKRLSAGLLAIVAPEDML